MTTKNRKRVDMVMIPTIPGPNGTRIIDPNAKPEDQPNYTDEEIDNMMQKLHMARRIAPPMVSYRVKVDRIRLDKVNLSKVQNHAKDELAKLYPEEDIDRSYDLNWLFDLVIRRIRKAYDAKAPIQVQDKNKKSSNDELYIILDNTCCIQPKCPSIVYMQLIIQSLRIATRRGLKSSQVSDSHKDPENETKSRTRIRSNQPTDYQQQQHENKNKSDEMENKSN
jgi:hypothetical protein